MARQVSDALSLCVSLCVRVCLCYACLLAAFSVSGVCFSRILFQFPSVHRNSISSLVRRVSCLHDGIHGPKGGGEGELQTASTSLRDTR